MVRIETYSVIGERVEVHRAACQIDHRSAGDANLWLDVGVRSVATAEDVARGRRQGIRAEIDVPQQAAVRACIAVRIKRVNVVVFGRDEDDVVRTLAGNRQVRNVQRLGIDLSASRNRGRNRIRKQLPERAGVNVGRREHRFGIIEALARQVIVPGEHVDRQQLARLEQPRTSIAWIVVDRSSSESPGSQPALPASIVSSSRPVTDFSAGRQRLKALS